MSRYKSLAFFLVLVVGGGFAIGASNIPGPWYAALKKPSFNPPNWVFAPAWAVLYFLIAVAGWRIWRRAPRSPAMALWWVQLAFNFAWSPVFFTAHRIGGALAVISGFFVSVAAFIVAAWPRDRIAALLFSPYLAWVGFAATLNAAIFFLN